MARFTMTEEIHAAPSDVFEVFADLRNAANCINDIKKIEVLTEGPIRAGTRFRETRIMFNKECTEEMEISEFTPGKSYSVFCRSCGGEITTAFRFTASRAGTAVQLDVRTRAVSLFAKLFSPLTALMFGPMMRKCMTKDIGELKAFIEEPGRGSVSAIPV